MPRATETTAVRTLLVLAALMVIVAGLKLAGTLLLPFLVAVFLSIVVAPFVLWLERRGLPPGWSVMVTMVVVIGVMLGFGALATQSVAGFEEAVPGYRAALDSAFAELVEWMGSHGVHVEELLRGDSVEPGVVVGMAGSFVGNIIAALSNTALVVLTMVFILLEVAGFPTKLRVALRNPQADLSELAEIMAEVQRYLALKTVVSAATGLCVVVLLTVVGVDFPLLWGMVAFLFNFIPNVGSIIAALPAMAVALVQPGQGPLSMVLVGVGYLVINTVIGNVIEPQLLGRRLGLSPLVVFVSLVFWGWVWGPVGMVISVPMTIAVRIALERHGTLQWVAVLLGPSPEWERPAEAMSTWWRRRRGVDQTGEGTRNEKHSPSEAAASGAGASPLERGDPETAVEDIASEAAERDP